MSDTGRENDPFAAFESDRTVIKPTATGRAAPAGARRRDRSPGRPARRRRSARAMAAAARKRRCRSTR